MKKNTFQKCIIFSLFVFLQNFYSCGLPVYYILEPLVNPGTPSDAAEGRFFSFRSSDRQNTQNASDIYLGVDLYYKIYNSQADCNADIQQIINANTEYSHAGFNKMQGLGYVKMHSLPSLPSSSDVLFEKNTNDNEVRIRLFTEGAEELSYEARFSGEPVNYPSASKPTRSNNKDFNFTENAPVVGDSDYKHNNESEEEYYYVAAFGVSFGRDGAFQPYYSSLLHLGIIKIPKN